MCNLYRMSNSAAEVARWLSAENDAGGANFGEQLYPGYPGLVSAEGKLQSMAWGFPLNRKGAKGQSLKPKPVNNARTDKLRGFFWRDSFEKRRCLIPVTAWAEAQGAKGCMTRTWMSLPDSEIFAVAGVWRRSDEFGNAYSMVMTDAAGDAASVHSRMPVILSPDQFETWTKGEAADAFDLCQAWPGPLTIDQTSDPWFARKAAENGAVQKGFGAA